MSLPVASTAPSSPRTRKESRRWSGTFSRSQALARTTTPVLRSRNRSSASSSGSSPGVVASRNVRATFGAGTKLTRSFFGSDRISATTRSCRSPGTGQVKSSAATVFSVATGMSTVTPSSTLPGSNV